MEKSTTINLNIGALFGAGSIVTTAVVGFIILYAGPKGVNLAPTGYQIYHILIFRCL